MTKPMTAAQWRTQMSKWGVDVAYQTGWETRKRSGSFSPVGVMIHHTGSTDQKQSYINWLFTRGHASVPGPLAHVMVMDSGKVPVGAIGRANHAGRGVSAVLSMVRESRAPLNREIIPGAAGTVDGNIYFYGAEVAYSGSEKMTNKQYASAVRWAAAVCDFHKWSASRVIGHGEWTSRKWDPGQIEMHDFRRDVAALLKAGPGVTPTPMPAPSVVLGKGDRGQAVKDLQKALIGRGYSVGRAGADGIFGADTEAAVIAFQTAAKIGVDGLAGDETFRALERVVAPKPATTIPFWLLLGNIQSGYYKSSPMWGPREEGIKGIFKRSGCSLYAVNEVVRSVESKAIRSALPSHFLHDGSPKTAGNDVFPDGKKFKIRNSWSRQIPGLKQYRTIEVIEFERDGVVFNHVHTHLPNGSAKQRRIAADWIVNHLKGYRDPILLTGDFNNETAYTVPYRSPRHIFKKAGFAASRDQAKNITNGHINELHTHKTGKGRWLSDAFTRGCRITDVNLIETSPRLTDHNFLQFRIELTKKG